MSLLSFAALAASGPLWEKNPRETTRRCRECGVTKLKESFSTGSTVCQQCVADNKLRRSRAAKAQYARTKR